MALRLVFNPINGTFDYVNDSSGGGAQSPNYVAVFNNTTSWGAPSAGLYTYTLTQATHNKGTDPIVQILQSNGGSYEIIGVDFNVNGSGDISIQVLEVPDNRFNGKIIISENN